MAPQEQLFLMAGHNTVPGKTPVSSPAAGSETAASLCLPDEESVRDLTTWVARGRALDDQCAVRLQAAGDLLVVTVPVLLAPVTVGLRVMRLAQPSDADWVVPSSAITDRLARMQSLSGSPEALILTQPPVSVQAAWAGISAPRAGWNAQGVLTSGQLLDAAHAGIRDIAEGTPDGAGSSAVATLRERIWSRPIAADTPSSLAFAAYALGLIRPGHDDEVQVARCGRWVRISTQVGYALTRLPAVL